MLGSDSAPPGDTATPGPPFAHALAHHPQACPDSSRTQWTNGLRPPVVPGTASRYPGRHSDYRRPPTMYERTLFAVGTGRTHIQACTRGWSRRASGTGPGNRVFCIWQPCTRDSCNKTTASDMGSGGLAVDAMSIGCLGMDRHLEFGMFISQ